MNKEQFLQCKPIPLPLKEPLKEIGVDFMKELIILILLGIGASTAWLTLSLLTGAVVMKVVVYLINKIEGEK